MYATHSDFVLNTKSIQVKSLSRPVEELNKFNCINYCVQTDVSAYFQFLHQRHSQNKILDIYAYLLKKKKKKTSLFTKSTIKSDPAALRAERGQTGNAAGEGEEVGEERRKGEAEGKGNPESGTGAGARTSPETERGKTAAGESGGRGSEAAAGRRSRAWGVGSCNGGSGEEGGAGSCRGGRWVEPSEEAGSTTGTAW